jgi:hypothetical protein
MANLKNTRTKPPLTREEHQALGGELAAMSARLSGLVHDLGARYAVRVVGPSLRAVQAVDAVRSALEDVLFREARGGDRAALGNVYFPATPDAAPKAAPVTSFATQPPVTQANKP